MSGKGGENTGSKSNNNGCVPADSHNATRRAAKARQQASARAAAAGRRAQGGSSTGKPHGRIGIVELAVQERARREARLARESVELSVDERKQRFNHAVLRNHAGYVAARLEEIEMYQQATPDVQLWAARFLVAYPDLPEGAEYCLQFQERWAIAAKRYRDNTKGDARGKQRHADREAGIKLVKQMLRDHWFAARDSFDPSTVDYS